MNKNSLPLVIDFYIGNVASPGIADFNNITRLSAVFCLLAVLLRCPSFNGRLKTVKTLLQFGKLRGYTKLK